MTAFQASLSCFRSSLTARWSWIRWLLVSASKEKCSLYNRRLRAHVMAKSTLCHSSGKSWGLAKQWRWMMMTWQSRLRFTTLRSRLPGYKYKQKAAQIWSWALVRRRSGLLHLKVIPCLSAFLARGSVGKSTLWESFTWTLLAFRRSLYLFRKNPTDRLWLLRLLQWECSQLHF